MDKRVKIKGRKKDKNLNHARELKNTMKHEGDGGTNFSWCTWNGLQRLGKATGKIENQ